MQIVGNTLFIRSITGAGRAAAIGAIRLGFKGVGAAKAHLKAVFRFHGGGVVLGKRIAHVVLTVENVAAAAAAEFQGRAIAAGEKLGEGVHCAALHASGRRGKDTGAGINRSSTGPVGRASRISRRVAVWPLSSE